MEIRFCDKRNLLDANGIERTTSKVNSAFAKFGYKLKRLELAVNDINGPKNGVDKVCRIVVKVKNMDEVVVSARDESLSKAISQAIKRAERTVVRQTQKHSIRDGDLHSRLRIAIYR